MQNIVLYWMMGSGKSTIWKELAKKLNYTFIDLDQYIKDKIWVNKLPEYIEKVWWDEFRDEEHRRLKEVLKKISNKKYIISLWWWTIVFERNRNELFSRDLKLVYIKVGLKLISERVVKDEKSWDKRTSLTGKWVLQELEEIFKWRKDIYETNCNFVVKNEKDIDSCVENIIEKVNYWWICIPLTKELNNIKGLEEFILKNKNNKKIEYLELRLDFLKNKDDLEKIIDLVNNSNKNILFTNRTSLEWGMFEWNANNSLDFYINLLDLLKLPSTFGRGARGEGFYIDIELITLKNADTEKVSKFKKLLKQNNIKLIISHHNFKITPDKEYLEYILWNMKDYNPDVYKMAVMPEILEDIEIINDLAEDFKIFEEDKDFIFISMWELWKVTRINIPKIWWLLTFWAYWDSSSAPGQIEYRELWREIFM